MKFIKSSALALVLMAFPAAAQQQQMPCAPRDVVTKSLATEHKEHVVLRGLANGNLIEIWLANEGGFSIILTRPEGGVACLLAAGSAMHRVEPTPKPGEKS